MKKTFTQLICMLTGAILILCALSCTGSNNNQNKKNGAFSAESFRLVRPDSVSKELSDGIKTFRTMIYEHTGHRPVIVTDNVEKGKGEGAELMEIVIGQTARECSKQSLEALNASKAKNEYSISFDGESAVIQGENDYAVMYALRTFLIDHVIPNGQSGMISISKGYSKTDKISSQISLLGNLYTIESGSASVLQSVSTSGTNKWPTYGRVIELKHSGDANGTLFATSQWAGKTFPIYSSTNGGKSWKLISEVHEAIDTSVFSNWQPEIYELPNAVGDMPTGTLLLAGCSHDSDPVTKTKICLWKSSDLGKSWEEIAVIDTGFGSKEKNGVYEPYLMCDTDGTLVCFYSDETEVTQHGGQRLVFKTSKDGVNWGEKQYCVAPADRSLRPGMVSVARMGDNGYIMSYEVLGDNSGGGGPVYYKTSSSLTEWDYKSVGTRLKTAAGDVSGHTPYCTWTPAGGQYGTVIMAGRCGGTNSTNYKIQSKLFLSFDMGKTWTVMTNPLEYDYEEGFEGPNYAYSFGFSAGSDGSIYHINNVFPKSEAQKYKSADLQFVKIKITGFDGGNNG